MRWLLVIAVVAGCYASSGVPCGELLCPEGRVCTVTHQCVLQAQVTACAGLTDADACSYPGVSAGVCYDSVCVVAGCGNLLVEPGEVCDDGNRISSDGCRFDCQSSELCGDGSLDLALGELCDCGATEPAPTGCSGPNSTGPTATCRPDCRVARCGDGIVDQSELCDDGNVIAGDGCRADCQGRYTKLQTPTAVDLTAAFVLGDRAWVVGHQGTVLSFDGSTVSIEILGNNALHSVWAADPSNVFVGGSGAIHHWDGTSWQALPTTVGQLVSDIWGTSATNVYAVTRDGGGWTGTVLHYTGGSAWTPITTCGTKGIFSIWGSSATNIFTAGYDGICWWNGSMWQSVLGTTAYLISGTSAPTRMFARLDSASRTSLDGMTWTPVVTPGPVTALQFVSPDRLLAASVLGVVLELDFVSQTWTHLLAPTELSLNGLAADGPSNVYIVGEAGTVLH